MNKIITSFVNPPIPMRQFDWMAWRDGDEEDGPHGWGKTEQEAIEDLIREEAWLVPDFDRDR